MECYKSFQGRLPWEKKSDVLVEKSEEKEFIK